MTRPIRPRFGLLAGVLTVFLGIAMVGIAGCHRTPDAADAKDQGAKDEGAKQEGAKDSSAGVTLTAEQVAKMGVATQAVSSLDYREEIAGYGVVVAHDTIATAVAELTSAQAAQEQSRSAAARAQRLAGTPGAMSADAVESATRQNSTDAAAVVLAQRRLSSVVGGAAPGSQLQQLAGGDLKLLRATFPLGALQGATPAALRVTRLDGSAPGTSAASPGWTLHSLWSAPADATLPGRSFFAVLKGDDASEGERLLVWAPGTGPAQHGVLVPAAAVVISDGKYWCYVEQKPHFYVRRELATDRPVASGYFVTQGMTAGEKVVTVAASLLLAREMNPSTEAD